MNCIGTYDGTIFYNPANKFCIVSVKTADQSVPAEARSNRRYKDHLIRFTAVGYEIPRTDAVELELDGEWTKGKYGVQLQVEQWREIVPRTKNGVEAILPPGLSKGLVLKLPQTLWSGSVWPHWIFWNTSRSGCWRSGVLRKINWRTSEPLMQKTVCSKEL